MSEPPTTTSALRATLEALSPEDRKRAIRDELLKRSRARRSLSPFAKYAHDPVAFARDELGVTLWSRQQEFVRAVFEFAIVCVASGHKTGKSMAEGAVIALCWLLTKPRGKVIMTSGNSDQVKLVLWDELTRVCQTSGILERIGGHLNADPRNGLHLPDGRFIVGLTAKDGPRIAGHSGDETLFIVDEANGFADELWRAIRGNLLGGAHACCSGNPTRTSGWFFEYFTTKKSEAHTMRISSRETPNYIEGRKVIPGLATREDVDALIREYGEGSAEVQIRVDGMHADENSNSVIGVGPLEAAVQRWSGGAFASCPSRLAIGVDVARFGDDDSVIQPLRGQVGGVSEVRHGFDTVAVAGVAKQMALDLRRTEVGSWKWERPIVIVDVSGLGAGVADQLRRCPEIELLEADSSTNANERDKHHRLRDELWWTTRAWLREGGALPPDPKRDEELLAPTYGFDGEGRTLVESKDSVKKRLKRSPDRADALCLAIARPGQGAVRSFRVGGA